MSWRDPNWKYYNAEESRKPGYLKERFDEIRRQMQQVEAVKRYHEDVDANIRDIAAKRKSK